MSLFKKLLQYLEGRKWSYLAYIIICIVKLFSSETTRQRDLKNIAQVRDTMQEVEELRQFEIRLMEDIDELTTLAILEPEVEVHDQNRLAMETALNCVRAFLWNYKAFRLHLPPDGPIGPWFLEWANERIYRPAKVWMRQKELCRMKGGCCERQCGCCEKPRRTDKGKTTIWADLITGSTEVATHCQPTACRCCLRSTNFDLSDGEQDIDISPVLEQFKKRFQVPD